MSLPESPLGEWTGQIDTSTIVTGFTAGSVLFIDSSTTLAQDNSNFFWDDTNNRLGIGTATPGTTLDVVGEATISSDLAISSGVLSVTSDVNAGGIRFTNATAANASAMAWYAPTAFSTARFFMGVAEASDQFFTGTAQGDFCLDNRFAGGEIMLAVNTGSIRFRVDNTGVSFNGVATIARPDYTITNPTTNRSLDVSAAALGDVRQVLGTLLQDLINYGLLQ